MGLFLFICLFFYLAYRFYAGYLERVLEVDKSQITPAHFMRDRVDYDPAPRLILFGHHFSAIAGSGPIVGPIIAALAFGWAPALLWILLGCVFLGATFDYVSIIASIRNQGKSLGQIARNFMGGFSYKVFLSFLLIILIYILIVFVDLAAATFAPTAEDAVQQGGVVATSSLIYIGLALVFGLALRRSGFSSTQLTFIFVPLIFITIWLSTYIPLTSEVVSELGIAPQKAWTVVLLIYCALASILPVWLLLQPRDFLSSFLLYACLFGGFIGILAAGFSGKHAIEYPSFITINSETLGPIFPILFVTIACGAISGFHCLVGMGTTSKQLDQVRDAKPIGYGGMLLEGVLGVLSIATVMICVKNPGTTPPTIFANGLGAFLEVFGLDPFYVSALALLAVSTFILTTLDAATRLTRFILQELLGLSNSLSTRWISSILIVSVPAAAVLLNPSDSPLWQLIWPAFGATNQLLAALGLFFLYLWRRQSCKKTLFISIPMLIMFAITITAMIQLILKSFVTGRDWAVGGVCAVLLLMTLSILGDALWKIYQGRRNQNLKTADL